MATKTPASRTPTRRAPRGRHWCLTLNNPQVEAYPHESWLSDLDIEYLIYGKEVGTSGTPHLQMYLCYINRKSLHQIKGDFPRAHIERMRGSPLQASLYCKKDKHWEEFGILPKTPAEKSSEMLLETWEKAYQLAKDGKIEEIRKDLLIRYYHAFKRIRQDNPASPQDLPAVCGEWLFGPTGVGKSYRARQCNPDFFDKGLNKWWDGYKGQDVVILDDVGESHATWIGSFLKRWADRYSFPAEEKNSTTQIRPKKIIVTSQYRIEQLFQGETLNALSRRFQTKNIIHWKKKLPFFPPKKTKKKSSISPTDPTL